jgi:MoaA/NifB/PqqE/SkfB family radical SAM enzyme
MSEFVRYVKKLTKPIDSRLYQLAIELTERCNNDCIHCCINQSANDKDVQRREMTTEQVMDILRQAIDLGCMQIHFTGGEPLLRDDFEELYLFVRRLGMKVLLFTNARLITPYLADLFARIPPLEPIEITVYGMHQESYEAVTRSPGSFRQFWRGVKLLLDRHVPFIVKSALLPPNKHEIDEFEAWAETIPWMNDQLRYALLFDLRCHRDNEEKNSLIESLRLSPREVLDVYFRNKWKYGKWSRELASKFLHPVGDRLFNCAVCEGREACVDAYGHAQPCIGIRVAALMEDMIRTGDSPSQLIGQRCLSLSKALNSFRYLRELRARNPEYLRRCAACFLKGVCEQCPAKSWAENGTLDTPVEYLCEMNHAMARYLGWLGEKECAWIVPNPWEKK